MKFERLRRRRRNEELDAEIQQHLDQAIRDRIERGESPEQARRNALREFGNVGLVKEVTQEMWGWTWLENLGQDLRFGLRMLLKKPGFALVAVITLALGVGANTAIFSIVNAVLLRPLPYADDERLAMIWGRFPSTGIDRLSVSVPEYIDYRDRTTSFSQVGTYGSKDFNLTGSGEAERLSGALVSANLPALLGVNPALGRSFLAEENQPERSQVVILSYGLWQRRFGGDPKLIGREITLNSVNCTVVGVMPPGFKFLLPEIEILQPLDITAARLNERYSRWLTGVARLKPGVTMAQAQAEMDKLARLMQREYPKYYSANSGWGIHLVSLRDELAGDVRTAAPILLAVVACVLLIACANVANLLLARANERRKEFALRSALGASRRRLLRQLLSESLLLSLAGGGLGVLLAWWSNRYLVQLGPQELSSRAPIGLDGPVLLFTLLVSLLTAVLFGLAPSWQAARLNLNDALKEGGRNSPAGRSRLRNLLVISEIAMALALLVGAGLALKSFSNLLKVDPGVDPARVLTMQMALSPAQYPDGGRQRALYEQALRQIEALPGVQAAGAVHNLPLSGSSNTRNFSIEGSPELPLGVDFYQASPNYFGAMGLRLENGRFFTQNDREGQPYVAVINETLARRFFPSQDPLGKRIKMGAATGEFPWLSIVGVIRDVKHDGLDKDTKPALYVSYLQPPLPNWKFQYMNLTVRTHSDPLSLVPSIRNTLQSLDKNEPINRIATMEDLLSRSMAARKFNMLLLSLFAALALALSVIGLYSVLSYLVAQRTHEIGVRMALGAQTGAVLRLTLRQGMTLALLGVMIGVAAAFALTRFMKTLLFAVEPTDPTVFGSIALLLLLVALLACWIPARRATKVDPLIALRSE
jgi:predicted permease